MSPAPKLPPREEEASEQADTALPRQESADEEDGEEEESGALKDSQKALEKGQGAQQLEGKDMVGLEPRWWGGMDCGESGIEALGFGFLGFGSYPFILNLPL